MEEFSSYGTAGARVDGIAKKAKINILIRILTLKTLTAIINSQTASNYYLHLKGNKKNGLTTLINDTGCLVILVSPLTKFAA